MHKHLLLGLLGLVAFSANPAASQIAPAIIVPTKEDGRTVYVDVPPPSKDSGVVSAAPQYGPRKIYLYYSTSEHRWKRVPPNGGATMRAARSAAKDVQQYILWRQQQPAFRVNFGESTPEAAAKPAEAAASADNAKEVAPELTVTGHKGLTAEQLDAIIDESAAQHGVDSNLVRAVIKVESNFNPRAVSRKGAMGLMQLMPSTARSLQVKNPFDARQNVDGGVRHLKSLLEDFNGDVTKSVAAYNAGAGAVTRNHGVPPFAETQAYVRRINQLYIGDTPLRRGIPAPIHTYRDKFGILTFTND
jgi:hypothetical protein